MSIFVPLEGTYLVVRIDPVATVKYFEDPDITAAARKLPTKKYIGYVSSTDDYPRPQRPYHRCRLEFVGHGVPMRSSDGLLQPDMCVPIAPITQLPIFREPLFSWPPFPFVNCYQYSFMNAVVRIPTQVIHESMTWRLSTREIFKHIGYLVEDDGKREQLSTNFAPGPLFVPASMGPDPALTPTADNKDHQRKPTTLQEPVVCDELIIEVPRGIPSEHDSRLEDGDSDATRVFASGHGEESSSASDYAASTRNGNADSATDTVHDRGLPFTHMYGVDADFVPVVYMSVDLTEIDEVSDPNGFLEEQDALNKLVSRAKIRQLSKWRGEESSPERRAGYTEDEACSSTTNDSPLVTPRRRFGTTKLLASGKKRLRRLSAALAGSLPLRKPQDH